MPSIVGMELADLEAVGDEHGLRLDEGPRRAVARVDLDAEGVTDLERLVAGLGLDLGGNLRRKNRKRSGGG